MNCTSIPTAVCLVPFYSKPVPLAVSQACGDCVGCSYVTIAYLLCNGWITLSFHYEPCRVKFLYLLSATLYTTTYDPPLLSLSLPPLFYHLSSSASLHLLFPQLFIPPPAALLLSHSCVPYFFCLPLSSFCSAFFLSSLPVDSEIPVLCKFWPWFIVGQEILVCRQSKLS